MAKASPRRVGSLMMTGGLALAPAAHGIDQEDAVVVFDVNHQQAPAGVQHDKVGMGSLGADGHVVPQQVVGIELLL